MKTVKIDLPGYVPEPLKSGATRHRVRVAGNKGKRMTLPVGPDHPSFMEHYHAARRGLTLEEAAEPKALPRSLQWLVDRYLAHLEREVAAGIKSPLTLRQRRSLLQRMCAHEQRPGEHYGEFTLAAPQSAFVRLRNAMVATPAAADHTVQCVRAMYAWAVEEGLHKENPAAGIKKIHTSKGGAVPWSPEDLRRYRETHPAGTSAHLYLTLLMFTGCRIGDAIWLGPANEIEVNGRPWLRWQPRKKGSALVEIPMLEPLVRATRAAPVKGDAYLLSESGRPFKNPESLRVRFRRWCDAAGLENRSSHGVRKALAELLAEAGLSSRQIMAVMSHSQAATSEIYTRGAERRILAEAAMDAAQSVEW